MTEGGWSENRRQMEQPKSSTLKREHRELVSEEFMSLPDVAEIDADDFEEQKRVAEVMCDAVDLIVESRSAAIAAIRDSHMASLTAHLQLMLSQLPIHIRQMPMKQFLKQHCPNTIDSTRSDGTLYFEVVQKPIERLQTPGELLAFSSSTLASGSHVRTRQAVHHRSEARTIHILYPDD